MIIRKFALGLGLLASIASVHAQIDPFFQEDAVALCQTLKQKNYTSNCMSLIKKVSYDSQALAYCEAQGSWNKVKSCLQVIGNVHYDDSALAVCTTAKYFGLDLKNCLNDIANKQYVSPMEVKLCAEESTYKRKTTCLQNAASKAWAEPVVEEKPEEKSEATELEYVEAEVKKAYAQLKANNTVEATLLLHELVKRFDEPPKTQ